MFLDSISKKPWSVNNTYLERIMRRQDSLEETTLGKYENGRKPGRPNLGWIDSRKESKMLNLQVCKMAVEDGTFWRPLIHKLAMSQRRLDAMQRIASLVTYLLTTLKDINRRYKSISDLHSFQTCSSWKKIVLSFLPQVGKFCSKGWKGVGCHSWSKQIFSPLVYLEAGIGSKKAANEILHITVKLFRRRVDSVHLS